MDRLQAAARAERRGGMKTFFTSAAVALLTLLAAGCGSEETREFWMVDFSYTGDYRYDSEAWYRVSAEKRGENSHAVVYVADNALDAHGNLPDDSDIESIMREFSGTIYPTVTGSFTEVYDVDRNGKTILLICDIKDDFENTGAYVGGYFFTADFFSNASLLFSPYKALKSNEADMVYIDCYPQNIKTEDAWRTVAHEFQHLVHASFAVKNDVFLSDTWIDEGFAEAANHMCYGEITDSIERYNGYMASGKFDMDQSLFYWNTTEVNLQLLNYSQSYLFFQYLRSQSASKDAFFKGYFKAAGDYLADYTDDYMDYRAVVRAVRNDSSFSSDKWGSSDDDTFNRLLLRWYAANTGLISGSLYQYDDEIVTKPLLGLWQSDSAYMGAGAGVVVESDSIFNSKSDEFAYMSLSGDGTQESFAAPYSAYGYFVAVNRVYSVEDVYTANTMLPEPTQSTKLSELQGLLKKSSSVSAEKAPVKVDPVFAIPLGDLR